MPNFCLPKDRVDTFLQGLKSGEIDPEALANMQSADRHAFLSQYVGDDAATKVNAEFESKLLLKNKQQGMITWAKNVAGLKPETRRDLINKVQKMERILDPEEEDAFLNDLAETKLGFGLNQTEAKTIADLSKKVSDLESVRNADKTFPSEEARLNYGRAVEDMTEYVAGLKRHAESLKLGDLKTPQGIGKLGVKTAGNLKSLSASLDNSSIFRQGWKTLVTNPNVWRKNAGQTFITMAKEVGGKNVLREVNADIISRPNYDQMIKAKLAIKNPEEAFPESLAEKVPGFGRLYKASESAYTGFLYKTRADLFDKYLKIAEDAGVNTKDPNELQAMGKLINSMTGRGNLGALERIATPVNNLFFSPRFLKSNIDTLTIHAFDKNITPFVRKQAAINLTKMIGATVTILGTANALAPGSVDWDPRSTDFGKIKIGNTRFDTTAGMGSIVTLASRLATGSTKSSTGKITDMRSEDFGARDAVDLVTDFFRNKLSPAASLATNTYLGRDNLGEKTDFGKEAIKSVTPIGIQNATEALKDPNSANDLITIIADGLGISANTYTAGRQGNSWQDSTSKELSSFKGKIGEERFNKANQQFDQSYNAYVNQVTKNPAYQKLSDDQKSTVLNKKQDLLKKDIFKQYGFTYKPERTPKGKYDALLK